MPPLVRREEGVWRLATCKLQMADATWKDVKVFRLGDLVVHLLPPCARSDQAGARWGLSHYHTGLLILWTVTEADCKRIGAYLWAKQSVAFREEEPHRVTHRMAGWVVPWVRECRRQKKWVDPTVFLQEEDAK